VTVDVRPRTPDPVVVDGPPMPDAARRRARVPARLLIGLVHAYQLLRAGRPTGCRYLPTCSEYAAIAIGRHGAWRGTGLAVRRVLRCRPWGGHGVDPVPEERVA
jgi:uncharacterized protein